MRIGQVMMALGVLSLSLSTTSQLTAQKKAPKLTARELFYTTPAKSAPTAAQTAKPKAAKQATLIATRKQPASAKTRPERSAAAQEPVQATLATLRQDEAFVPVAFGALVRPLGLRYSILKYAGDQEYMEVDPDLVFRSGDRIRVTSSGERSGVSLHRHEGFERQLASAVPFA